MVNDVWAVALISNLLGHDNVNTMHFRETVNTDDLSPQAMAIQIAQLMKTEVDLGYTATLPSSSTMSRVEVVGITHPTVSWIEVVGDAGGNTGTETLPAQSSQVVQKLTAKRGRSYNGRCYHPAGLEGDQNNGLWLSSRTTLVANFWGNVGALFNLALTVSFAMVVYSPTLGTSELVTELNVTRHRQLLVPIMQMTPW